MAEVESSDDYEEPAIEWLYEQVKALARTLERAGVVDEQTRRKVCEDFFFSFAVELDGDTRPPRDPQPRVIFEGADRTLARTEMFGFHDYVFGVVGQAFGDD